MHNSTLILLVLFIVYQVLDVVTTWYAISKGYAQEANPIMKRLMAKAGILPPLVILKLIVTGVLISTANLPYMNVALTGLSIFYSWVVINNFLLIRKARK